MTRRFKNKYATLLWDYYFKDDRYSSMYEITYVSNCDCPSKNINPDDYITHNNSYFHVAKETSLFIRDVIIVINVLGVEDDKRGKGNGTRALNKFIRTYNNDYDIMLEAGLLAESDKQYAGSDKYKQTLFMDRLLAFYARLGFLPVPILNEKYPKRVMLLLPKKHKKTKLEELQHGESTKEK